MNIKEITKQQISKLSELSLVESEDVNAEHLCQMHYRKFGQLRIPTIAVVEGNVRVVDGLKYLRAVSTEAEVFKINYVGVLNLHDFYVLRIYHNFQNSRTFFINMAEIISEIATNKLQIQSVANKTNLTPIEVERYTELLDFDWEEFRRTPINEDQYKLL